MKISIITVTYNSEKTIKDTFDSVLLQDYKDVEYIVVDGNSKDRTKRIIEQYEKKFYDKDYEFKWISEKDEGIYDAINKGVKIATGDIVGILNSDDYYADRRILNDIYEALNDDKIDCVHGNLNYIDPISGEIVRRWTSKEFEKGLFSKSWTPAHPTFYVKNHIYKKYDLYKTDYKIAADVELMYRYLEINHVRSKYLDRQFIKMRQGGVSSNGIKSTITITKEMMKAFKENGKRLNLVKYLFFKGLKIKQFVK